MRTSETCTLLPRIFPFSFRLFDFYLHRSIGDLKFPASWKGV